MSGLWLAVVIFAGWIAACVAFLAAVRAGTRALNGHKPMPLPARPGSDGQFEAWVDLDRMADDREAAERRLRRYR